MEQDITGRIEGMHCNIAEQIRIHGNVQEATVLATNVEGMDDKDQYITLAKYVTTALIIHICRLLQSSFIGGEWCCCTMWELVRSERCYL